MFDLETYSLHANTAILLCAVIKEIGSNHKPVVIRADDFPEWKTCRSNPKPIVTKVIRELIGNDSDPDSGYDIFVAHNGMYFDRRMLNTWALKYRLPIDLRFSKLIDPVLLLRKHCRLNRNSLAEAIDFFEIPHKKTPIDWSHWMKASFDGNSKSLDYITSHCIADVRSLEALYHISGRLVKNIDEKGSAF